MILIAHRGNINGPRVEFENNPEYVLRAIEMGFDAEVDVWLINGKFFLGHDEPQYEVDKYFLNRSGLWCHAKNVDALSSMISLGAHCFWHEEDGHTITSKGYIWTHPKEFPCKSGIYVSNTFNKNLIGMCQGVCSDYVSKYKTESISGKTK